MNAQTSIMLHFMECDVEPGVSQIVILISDGENETGIINCPRSGCFHEYFFIDTLKKDFAKKGIGPLTELPEAINELLVSLLDDDVKEDFFTLNDKANKLYKLLKEEGLVETYKE